MYSNATSDPSKYTVNSVSKVIVSAVDKTALLAVKVVVFATNKIRGGSQMEAARP